MALVGRQRRARAAVGAPADRVEAALGQPEALEPIAQLVRLAQQRLGAPLVAGVRE
jgi:hypothetical protein